MSNIFSPKRVPGLLTDDEMALGMKEYAAQQKATAHAAPPNTSALGFASTIMGNAANDLKQTVQSAPSPQPLPLTGVEAAGDGGLRVDPAEAAQRPNMGLLGPIGVLEPGSEEQAAEHAILTRNAEELVRGEEEAADFREAQASQWGPPVEPGSPEERQWQLQQQLEAAADRRRPLAEAQTDLAAVEATPPTQTWWRNAVDVGVRGFALTGTSVPQWWLDLSENAIWAATGINASDNPASQWFDSVDKAITDMLPGDKARSQEFVSELAAGSGSMAAFLIAGYVGSVFGAPAGVAAGLTGGMSTGNQLYEESQQFSATGLQKFLSFFGGSFLGLSEGIPIEGAIRRALPYDRAFFQANRESNGLLLRMLNNTTASSLEEFIQEFGQSAGQDLIAKFAFDPDRELDIIDWGRAGIVGGVLGAGMGTAASVLGETGVLTAEPVSRIDPTQQQKIAETVLAQGKTQLNSILGREPEARTAAEPEGGVATAPEGSAVTTVEGVSSVPAQAAKPRPTVQDRVRDIVDTAAFAQEQLDIAAQAGREVELAEGVSVQVAPAVETPQFKTWFGASKVVDEAGAPLRVFHGTVGEGRSTGLPFRQFEPARQGSVTDTSDARAGFWFTQDFERARLAASEAKSVADDDTVSADIMEVYVSMQNPLVLDSVREYDPGDVAEIAEKAKADGHDGLVFTEGEGGGSDYLVFEPTQIKSATANTGAFDPNDPNIDRQMAPPDPNIAATIKAIQLEPSETQPLPAHEASDRGPIPIVVAAARAYADAAGLPHRRARSYVKVDVSRATRIAQAYTDMKHEPDDPAVQAAYRAFGEEVEAQHVYALAAGADLSPNPDAPQYPAGHPMAPLAEKFWALHRYFGTGLEGATDPENMWQAYSRLFSATAVPAMTTETRGAGESVDRKSGLMPSWTWQEGVEESSAYALDGPVVTDAETFRARFAEAKDAHPRGAAVQLHTTPKYAKMKTFLAPDGLSGFALDGADIVSVFVHPTAGGNGRLKKIIDTAIANGGRTLDAFDGKLVQLYAALGFRETRHASWSDAQRPDGWQDSWGKPDVVFMEFEGAAEQTAETAVADPLAEIEADPERALIDRAMGGTSITRQPYAMEPTRPAAGIPEADPNAVPVDTTLAGISKDFADLFDLTVRQKVTAGGKDAGRVMGEYNRRQATVRLRTWNDLSTLVHEGGHAFHDSVAADPAWRTFFANSRKNLLKASKLYQGDLSKATSDVKQREGFAEFFRVYALTPQYARKQFPQLTADFEAQLKTYDQRLLDGLGGVATQFGAWLRMPSTSLLSGMVVSGYRHTGIGAAIKELREAGVTTWMHEVATRNASWAINRFAPINLLVDQLLQLGETNRGQPLDLSRADDPRVQVRLAGNTDRRAQQSVTGGVLGYRSLDSTSRGLQDVLLRSQDQPLGKTPRGFDEERHKDFGGYLVARRALAEYERYEQGELTRPPIDATKGEVIRAIKDYEAKYGDSFTEAAQWAHEYGMALWQLRYDAGLLDRETYQEGRKRAFYAPLQRDVSDKKGGFSSSSLTSGDRLTKGPRFKGSSRQVIDPMAVLMEMTFAVEKQVAQNDAKKYLARLADRAGKAGALVERVPATQLVGTPLNARQVAAKLLGDDSISDIDAADMMAVLMATYEKDDAITLFRSEQAASVGQNALFFWEDGKMAAILVKDGDIGRDIVETMNAVGRENMDMISTAIATTSSVFRNAITLWPDFLIMNFLRDQPAAWILTEGYVPFWGALRGGFDEVTQKQIAKSYNASRGALGGMVNATLHVERVNRDIRTLTAKGYAAQAFGDVQHGWDIPGVLRGLSRFTELAETGTRLGVYRATYNRAIKEGLAPYEAGVEAAYLATDLMDFGLNGSKMLTTRRLIPFLNAQLQGLYKLYRTLGADEVSRRRGIRMVLRAYVKGTKGMQLSRVEEQHIRIGRKAWIKMVALGVISAALHLLYEDDPDYQEASEYMRATGWVIPTGKPGEIFYFPKPFELAIFANATERLLEFSGGDAAAPGRFLRGLALNMSPPTDVPLLELGYSLATNTDIFTGGPVVPEHMKGFAPYLQYDRYTSNIAKWLAGMTGQSPMVVDHMMSSLFAGAYRDVARVVDAMDPARPAAQIDDAPITRRLVRDARRGGTALTDFYAQASARSSVLSRALSAYKQEIDAGNEVAANENLSRMTDDEKAYALLMTHYDADNKRLHPFYRANQVVTVVNKMRREIASSLSLADTTDPKDPLAIQLSAKQKAELDDMLSEVVRREVRNTMIATGQAGWSGKELLPLDQTFDILAAFSPDTFYELERRYAKAKIYDAESVAEAWPEVRDRLLWDREAADLSDLVVVAREGL